MQVEIITPEEKIFQGEADVVTLPGKKGSFTILNHHAPIISLLTKGNIILKDNENEYSFSIEGGFIELSNNKVTICVETQK